MEDVVGDVESRSEPVARLLRGIAIVTPQTLDILIRTQHGSHHHLVERDALRSQTVEEGTSNLVKKARRTGHKIGNGVRKMLDVVKRTGTDIDVFRTPACRLVTVLTAFLSQALGGGKLHIVKVGKEVLETTGDGCHLVLHRCAVGIQQLRHSARALHQTVDVTTGKGNAVVHHRPRGTELYNLFLYLLQPLAGNLRKGTF